MAGQYAPEIQQRLDAYKKAADDATAADQEQETAAGALAEAERSAYTATSKALDAHRKASEAARELIEQWTTGPGGGPQKPGK